MSAALIIVAVLLAFALAACAFLLRDRFRIAADTQIIRADKGHLARLCDKLTADLAARETLQRTLDKQSADLSAEVATLRERVAAAQRREQDEIARRAQLTEQFKETFDALAGKALDASTKRFLELAKQTFAADQEKARADLDKRQVAVDQLVKPIAETLKKTDEKLAALEKDRTASYAELKQQVRAMAESNQSLTDRTGDLVKALRKPQVRGRYGEIQLERVAELAGMRSFCDFSTQQTIHNSGESALRPDMVVRLPNGRIIAIDAKTNIDAYLDAIEADTPEKAEECMARFARHVADQAAALAKKEYQQAIDGSLDFVVMFIPGDQFVDAALQRRPDLLDLAAERSVIIASPSTLIGLLRAVHVGWREKGLSDSAQELFNLGRELHDRAVLALNHAEDLGGALRKAVSKYNDFVGSVDGRLMPTIRKFEESGAKSSRETPDLAPIEALPRKIQSLTPSLPGAEKPRTDASPDVVVRAPAPSLRSDHS